MKSIPAVPFSPATALQYNNLRDDVLYLGQEAANAVTVAQLFRRWSQYVKLVRQSATVARIPYDTKLPPSLVINGCPLQATANVDSPALAGGVGTYYLHAVRTNGSTSFTLVWTSTAVEALDQRLLGSAFWDGGQILPNSLVAIDLNAGSGTMKVATEAGIYLPTDTTTLYLGGTASGTWVTLSAALAVDLLLLAVYGSSNNAGAIIEIGKGAAGAEVIIARSRVAASNIVPLGLGVKVPAGSRLALRWINTSGTAESFAIQALPLTGVTDF